jgi:hypothetical protein
MGLLTQETVDDNYIDFLIKRGVRINPESYNYSSDVCQSCKQKKKDLDIVAYFKRNYPSNSLNTSHAMLYTICDECLDNAKNNRVLAAYHTTLYTEPMAASIGLRDVEESWLIYEISSNKKKQNLEKDVIEWRESRFYSDVEEQDTLEELYRYRRLYHEECVEHKYTQKEYKNYKSNVQVIMTILVVLVLGFIIF